MSYKTRKKRTPQFAHMGKASRRPKRSGALGGTSRSQDDSSVSQAAATSPSNVKDRVAQDLKDSSVDVRIEALDFVSDLEPAALEEYASRAVSYTHLTLPTILRV